MAKRKIYSAEVKVWATVYVIASSAKEARATMRGQLGDVIEVEGEEIFGGDFADPDMPIVSYSPAMTVAERGSLHGFGLADECEVEPDDGEG